MDNTSDLDLELDTCLEAARGLLAQAPDGDPDDLFEASDLANHALRLRPDSAEAWLVKCQALSALGDDVAALACVEKSVALDPSSAEAHYWNAAVLSDLDRPAEALAAAEIAFAAITDDDDWLLEEVYYEKAIILDALDQREAALAVFREGLARFPESPILKAGLEPLHRDRLRRSLKVIQGGLR